MSFSFPLLWPIYQHSTFTFPLSLIPHSLSIPRLLFSRTSRKMVGKCMCEFRGAFFIFHLLFFWSLLSHFPASSEPKISPSRYPEILIQLLGHQTQKLSVKPILLTSIPTFLTSPISTISFPNYPRPLSLSTTLPPMGQIISVIQRCLPFCFPLPESEDQNEASQVVGVQDPNEDGTVSTILKNSYPIYIYNPATHSTDDMV